MLADFVSKRGGGLLMIGGRRSFAEGGWAGTPVAEVLPVEFENAPREAQSAARRRAAHGAADARRRDVPGHAARTDRETPRTPGGTICRSSRRSTRPRASKPGATVLLTGTDRVAGRSRSCSPSSGTGAARRVAFPVQDSWVWQMDATIAVEDMTHETFWRRLVRWLVDGVPDPVDVTTAVDRVEPGEPMQLTAEVVDPAFVEVNDAQVVAQVTAPSGKVAEVPLEWTVTRDGEYRGSVRARRSRARTRSARPPSGRERRVRRASLGSSLLHARASAGDSEYFDAAMRAPLLQRVAEDTGGRFFTPANAASLPEAISYSGRGVTVVEERDLWDMPILLLLLLGLIGAEWGFRRQRGLA